MGKNVLENTVSNASITLQNDLISTKNGSPIGYRDLIDVDWMSWNQNTNSLFVAANDGYEERLGILTLVQNESGNKILWKVTQGASTKPTATFKIQFYTSSDNSMAYGTATTESDICSSITLRVTFPDGGEYRALIFNFAQGQKEDTSTVSAVWSFGANYDTSISVTEDDCFFYEYTVEQIATPDNRIIVSIPDTERDRIATSWMDCGWHYIHLEAKYMDGTEVDSSVYSEWINYINWNTYGDTALLYQIQKGADNSSLYIGIGPNTETTCNNFSGNDWPNGSGNCPDYWGGKKYGSVRQFAIEIFSNNTSKVIVHDTDYLFRYQSSIADRITT